MNAHQRRIAARRFERTHGLAGIPWKDLHAVVDGQTTHVRLSGPLQRWSSFARPHYMYGFRPALDDPWAWHLGIFESGARNYYLWRRNRAQEVS